MLWLRRYVGGKKHQKIEIELLEEIHFTGCYVDVSYGCRVGEAVVRLGLAACFAHLRVIIPLHLSNEAKKDNRSANSDKHSDNNYLYRRDNIFWDFNDFQDS